MPTRPNVKKRGDAIFHRDFNDLVQQSFGVPRPSADPIDGLQHCCWVYGVNARYRDMAKGDCCLVDGVYPADDPEKAFYDDPIVGLGKFYNNTYDRHGSLGIALEPIKEGKAGKVAVAGDCFALVWLEDNGRYYGVEPDIVNDRLKPTPNISTALLRWLEPYDAERGPGLYKCLISLARNPGQLQAACEIRWTGTQITTNDTPIRAGIGKWSGFDDMTAVISAKSPVEIVDDAGDKFLEASRACSLAVSVTGTAWQSVGSISGNFYDGETVLKPVFGIQSDAGATLNWIDTKIEVSIGMLKLYNANKTINSSFLLAERPKCFACERLVNLVAGGRLSFGADVLRSGMHYDYPDQFPITWRGNLVCREITTVDAEF